MKNFFSKTKKEWVLTCNRVELDLLINAVERLLKDLKTAEREVKKWSQKIVKSLKIFFVVQKHYK